MIAFFDYPMLAAAVIIGSIPCAGLVIMVIYRCCKSCKHQPQTRALTPQEVLPPYEPLLPEDSPPPYSLLPESSTISAADSNPPPPYSLLPESSTMITAGYHGGNSDQNCTPFIEGNRSNRRDSDHNCAPLIV